MSIAILLHNAILELKEPVLLHDPGSANILTALLLLPTMLPSLFY